MYEELKKAVCDANIELHKQQLVICSWGNVSGIDRSAGIVAIKPSGLEYDELAPDKELGNGRPARIRRQDLTNLRIGENVHGLELNFVVLEHLDHGRRKSASRSRGRSLHEERNLVLVNELLDLVENLFRHGVLPM